MFNKSKSKKAKSIRKNSRAEIAAIKASGVRGKAKRQAVKTVKAQKREDLAENRPVLAKVKKIAGKLAPIPPVAKLLISANRKQGEKLIAAKARAAGVSPVTASIEMVKANPELKAFIASQVSQTGVTPANSEAALIAQAAALREQAAVQLANEQDMDVNEAWEDTENEMIEDGMYADEEASYNEDSEEDYFIDPASIAAVASGIINKGKEIIEKSNAKRLAKGKKPLFMSKKKFASLQEMSKKAAATKLEDAGIKQLSKATNKEVSAAAPLQPEKSGTASDIIEEVKRNEKNKWVGENMIFILLGIAFLIWVGRKSNS